MTVVRNSVCEDVVGVTLFDKGRMPMYVKMGQRRGESTVTGLFTI
jgi:hypothetical protein